jgi:hypothetical protein
MTIFCLSSLIAKAHCVTTQRECHCHPSLQTVSNSPCPPPKRLLTAHSTTYDRLLNCDLSPRLALVQYGGTGVAIQYP